MNSEPAVQEALVLRGWTDALSLRVRSWRLWYVGSLGAETLAGSLSEPPCMNG